MKLIFISLLGSATTLLTRLSNPFNITLLSAQLLSAPAIWHNPHSLQTTVQVLSIFNAASARLQAPRKLSANRSTPLPLAAVTVEEWVAAVIKAADERSPRWRHLIIFGGVLLGLSRSSSAALSSHLQRLLESATISATNLAIREHSASNTPTAKSIAVILSYIFGLLSDEQKLYLDHDRLLPILYQPPLFDQDGLRSGYFLSAIDADVIEASPGKFEWALQSTTYLKTQSMVTGPLFSSLGPLARLIAFSVEKVQNLDLIATMVEDLATLARSLCVQWRQNKLSEIDASEETTYLTDNALKTTLPLLWQVLKSTMFATVIILRSVLGRVIGDARLGTVISCALLPL